MFHLTAPHLIRSGVARVILGLGVWVIGLWSCTTLSYAATLTLDPASGSLGVDETVEVAIDLGLDGESVKGVDALLTFNPSYLQVVSISNGSVFGEIVKNFNNTDGSLSVTAVAVAPVTSEGTLATVTFRTKATGSVTVGFDYTSGSKIDSNVLEYGTNVDLLSSITNATYNITATAESPVPSVTAQSGLGGSGGTVTTPTPTSDLPQAGHAEALVLLLGVGCSLMLMGWFIQVVSTVKTSYSLKSRDQDSTTP